MRPIAIVPAALLAFALVAAPAEAQVARLYGYERAPFVTGTVSLLPDKGEVSVQGFSSRYREPLTVMMARAFDPRRAVKVGELPAGFSGDVTFPLPAGAGSFDTVILLAPGDSTVPVGLGLVR